MNYSHMLPIYEYIEIKFTHNRAYTKMHNSGRRNVRNTSKKSTCPILE